MKALIKNISPQELTIKIQPINGETKVVDSDITLLINEEIELSGGVFSVIEDTVLKLEELGFIQILALSDETTVGLDLSSLEPIPHTKGQLEDDII